jgi:hypothetical protein
VRRARTALRVARPNVRAAHAPATTHAGSTGQAVQALERAPGTEREGGAHLGALLAPGGLAQRGAAAAAPGMVAGLQRSVGNQAVQRLVTAAGFKEATDAGTFATRGPVLREIDEWLAEYHKHNPPKNQAEKELAGSILDELAETTDRWLTKHAGDATKSVAKRVPNIEALKRQIDAEKGTLAKLKVPKDGEVTKEGKELKAQMEGDVNSRFASIGGLIDAAVPQKDDSAKITVELSIPAGGTGVFVILNLEAGVEREDHNQVKVGMSVGAGAKGSAGLAEIAGEIGGYLESTGANGKEAMTLISYALYRKCRESSVIPREVSNYMWGGSTSDKGFKLAEKWAAKVEKDIFETDAAGKKGVELGAYAKGKVSGGVTGAKLSGEVKYKTGRKYTKDSITKLKARAGGRIGEADAVPTARGAAKKIGAGTMAFEAAFGVQSGPIEGGLKVAASFVSPEREKQSRSLIGRQFLKYQFDSIGAEVSGKVTVPLKDVGKHGASLAAFLVKTGTRINNASDQMEDDQMKGAYLGSVDDVATWWGTAAASTGDTEWTNFKAPTDPTETGGKADVALELGGAVKKEAGKAAEGKLKLKIVETRGIESPVITAKLEQGKTIWSYPKS